jgi:mannose-6-phosphate isomerase-like protein (cupin superfamily)
MHFVGLTPDRNYICAADLGTDTVYVYDRALNLYGSAKVPDGHGVRHLAFSQDGKWMFAANELRSTVSVFAYKAGALELVDTCAAIPMDFMGESAIAAIRVRDDDIYVSNRGHDSISKLSFDGQKLTLLETFPTGGKTPRDFCFVGSRILCANQDSNTVTLLDREQGILQTVSVEIPVCVCVESQLEVTEYDGPGYKPLADFGGWRVAVANYVPKLELSRLDFQERHLETDEVFVLLQGEGGLLIGKERLQISLEMGKVYNVKRGIWHRVYMTPGATVLIVENTDTGSYNTDYCSF